jgi:hypothetical protein
MIEYKIDKKNIAVPLVIGTKSNPRACVGKYRIIKKETGMANIEKCFHATNVDSFSRNVISEKIKIGINIKLKITNK